MGRVVAIVQARLASTRLPAKILLDLGGKTALERCLRRVEQFQGVSEVVVATSDNPADDLVEAAARRMGFRVSRGSQDDVLSRYAKAAAEAQADAIVRCTSDCPLLDPALSSCVVDRFLSPADGEAIDYCSNSLDRRLPRGLDTEIFSREALDRAHREATEVPAREHVTLHIYRNPHLFRCEPVVDSSLPDLSHHRWTLDTLDDYRLLATIFNALGNRAESASLGEVLALLERNPEWSNINRHIEQKKI